MSFAKSIANRLRAGLSEDSKIDSAVLNEALRLLSKWRCALIANTFLQREGSTVLGGPFKGLNFGNASAEGCFIPKLLGCYEQPLHPYLSNIIGRPYSRVLNIGSAEGYYAVGLALAMPNTMSFAFDIKPEACTVCQSLANANQVQERVMVGGKFEITDFDKYSDDSTFAIIDIEGAEEELLNPELSPALRRIDILVESHECVRPGITKALINRFSKSHDIQCIEDNGSREIEESPAWFRQLAHLDQMLATWEWRSGATPWLLMLNKQTSIVAKQSLSNNPACTLETIQS